MKNEMSWHLYLLTFRLRSPLHVGFHKVMHLSRTRAYVPAKPLWGALTARLTRERELLDYVEVGNFLKEIMRFGYFYIFDGENLYMPKYTDEGLKFGNLLKFEFEKKFISSMASASIEPYSLTAEEGMLHQVEFINPHVINDEGKITPVFLRGLIWISEKGKFSVELSEDDFFIEGVKFSDLANTLQIGGEKKYGFGRLKLEELVKVGDRNLNQLRFEGEWREEEGELVLKMRKDSCVWSHVRCNTNLKMKGEIEPVVGRDWGKRGPGREVKNHGLCWLPGSVLLEDSDFRITGDSGLWELKDRKS